MIYLVIKTDDFLLSTRVFRVSIFFLLYFNSIIKYHIYIFDGFWVKISERIIMCLIFMTKILNANSLTLFLFLHISPSCLWKTDCSTWFCSRKNYKKTYTHFTCWIGSKNRQLLHIFLYNLYMEEILYLKLQ